MDVPYVSQMGNAARNDCGLACCLMLAGAVGRGKDVALDALARQFDVKDDGTTLNDLFSVFKFLGLSPFVPGPAEYPYIVLAEYAKLPNKRVRGNFLHWIVRLAPDRYHDPYWPGDKGANLQADPAELERAFLSARVSIREIFEMSTKGAPRVQYSRVYHLLPQNATLDQFVQVCRVAYPKRQTVGFSADDAGIGNLEDKTVVLWGILAKDQPAYQSFFEQHYPGTKLEFRAFGSDAVEASFDVRPTALNSPGPVLLTWQTQNARLVELNPGTGRYERVADAGERRVTVSRNTSFKLLVHKNDGTIEEMARLVVVNQASRLPIGRHSALPTLPFHLRLGVHVMERNEEALRAFDAGCRSFTVMDNLDLARLLRSRGAAVIYRRFVQHGVVPDPAQHVRDLGIRSDDEIMVMGLNEADNLPTSDLQRRFAWDKAFAEEVWRVAPRCFPVIGSFSMGTPQIEDRTVAQVWRDTYGRFLNDNADRVGLNYHSYHRRHSNTVPPWNHPVEDAMWWPQRFTRWGYNPEYGNLSKDVVLVGDETGVDIAGIGGFAACGYNEETFMRWWELRRAEYESLPHVYVQNVFQFSPRPEWAGYHIGPVFGAMQRIWQGLASA